MNVMAPTEWTAANQELARINPYSGWHTLNVGNTYPWLGSSSTGMGVPYPTNRRAIGAFTPIGAPGARNLSRFGSRHHHFGGCRCKDCQCSRFGLNIVPKMINEQYCYPDGDTGKEPVLRSHLIPCYPNGDGEGYQEFNPKMLAKCYKDGNGNLQMMDLKHCKNKKITDIKTTAINIKDSALQKATAVGKEIMEKLGLAKKGLLELARYTGIGIAWLTVIVPLIYAANKAYKNKQIKKSEKYIKIIIAMADTNKDGKVSLDEINMLIERLPGIGEDEKSYMYQAAQKMKEDLEQQQSFGKKKRRRKKTAKRRKKTAKRRKKTSKKTPMKKHTGWCIKKRRVVKDPM